MELQKRIELALGISEDIKDGQIEGNNLYDLQLHLSEALEQVKNFNISGVGVRSEQLKDKYTPEFEGWYKDYLSRPYEGLPDYYGVKIEDKEYLFKRWIEGNGSL